SNRSRVAYQRSSCWRLNVACVPVSRFTSGSRSEAASAGASLTRTGRSVTTSPVSVGLSAKDISAGTPVITHGVLPRPSTDSLLEELRDLRLVGGCQFLHRERGRPHGAVVEFRGVV